MTPARPLTAAERECAVSMAAAAEINDEVTIAINAAMQAYLEIDDPKHAACAYLLDIKATLQRITWRCAGLLNYAARRGVRSPSAPMERLIVEQDAPVCAVRY